MALSPPEQVSTPMRSPFGSCCLVPRLVEKWCPNCVALLVRSRCQPPQSPNICYSALTRNPPRTLYIMFWARSKIVVVYVVCVCVLHEASYHSFGWAKRAPNQCSKYALFCVRTYPIVNGLSTILELFSFSWSWIATIFSLFIVLKMLMRWNVDMTPQTL